MAISQHRNTEILFILFILPHGKVKPYATVFTDLLKLPCMTLTVQYVSLLVLKSCPAERCSWPRAEGADGKTKRLALLTPDKLTSDGALCSASGACWAEQLSVEPRTERREAPGLQTKA